MKNLKQQKQIICDITNRLFEVENIDADIIPNILFTYMNAVGCLTEAEDLDLIDKFVDSCNRKDLSILLIERLFDKAFFEIKEPTFEEVFNEGKECAPTDIFKVLGNYFGMNETIKL
jgi:hypothetical protein